MVLLIVSAFFGLVATGVLLLAFPGLRMRLAIALDATGQQFGHCLHTTSIQAGRSSRKLGRMGFQAVADLRLALTAIALVTAPPVVALLAGGPSLFSFEESAWTPDARIQGLLEGERLAPPPSLPPEVFTTREVEQFRPDIALASRDWTLLDPAFTQRLLWVMKTLREQHGYELVLIEGYRSPQRQAELAGQGLHVTQAGPNKSYHQYGLAADCAFIRNGRIVLSEADPWAMRGYQLYGQVAEAAGLVWGGRWQMRDFGHVELRQGFKGRPPPG